MMRIGLMDLRQRYQEDGNFKALADQLVAFMIQGNIQPYEVKDAALIAELIFRERVATPLYMESGLYSTAAIKPIGDKP